MNVNHLQRWYAALFALPSGLKFILLGFTIVLPAILLLSVMSLGARMAIQAERMSYLAMASANGAPQAADERAYGSAFKASVDVIEAGMAATDAYRWVLFAVTVLAVLGAGVGVLLMRPPRQ